MKLLIVLLLSSFLLVACSREIVCKGYNPEATITSFSLFQTVPDEINIANNWGDTLTILKNDARASTNYLETCGGMYDRYCECLAERKVSYYSNESSIEVSEYIEHFTDNKISFYSHVIRIGTSQYYTTYQTDNEVSNFKESLSDSIYSIQNETFSNILEINLDTLSINYQQYRPIVQTIWVKPDSGLFKMWINDTCWTVIQ